MSTTISAENAEAVRSQPDFAERFPASVRRMITLTSVLHDELPSEDIEIVDADAIYVNFGHREALVIGEVSDMPGPLWEICATAWDRTGGVSVERVLGMARGTELAALVKAILERIRLDEEELG